MAILLIDHELLYQTNEVRGAARMSPEKKERTNEGSERRLVSAFKRVQWFHDLQSQVQTIRQCVTCSSNVLADAWV